MRIVVKIGTQVVSGGSGPDKDRISKILVQIAELFKLGHEVILVASGALGSGISVAPEVAKIDGPLKNKVLAAIGQPVLIDRYSWEAQKLGFHVGQVLILRDDFTNKESFNNLVNIVEALVKSKVLPVLNENDVMETDDLSLGDNDVLAAMTSIAFSADKLIILTNRDGLFDDDPDDNKDAKVLKEVPDVDFQIEKMCSNTKSKHGSGGMISKVRAAKHATNGGIEVLIGNGRQDDILLRAIGKDFPGTRFVPRVKSHSGSAKRWMLSAKGVGSLIIDDGAIGALRSGKSLLFPGVISFKGDFGKKEVVDIMSKRGQVVAYGRVNYSSTDLQKAFLEKKDTKVKGKRILEKEVVHRDYMVILKNSWA